MECSIYKSLKKTDNYLFIKDEDDFSQVPQELLDLLGNLELVMAITLSQERRLAQADPLEVMRALEHEGYYLQLPPKNF
ncbi:MAG: YcgL domain-containing protein [Gammaproteobacteria bacterium]|nr:YcgL domain-containing protein [Gammaproteobacteria bacterium]